MADNLPQIEPNLISIIGAGTMGSGIALAALFADLHVRLYDVDQSMLERARSYIEEHLNRKHRSLSIRYLELTSRLEDLSGSAFVIEAASEILSLKGEIFARLGEICPPPAILATNTSTLPVTAIAASAYGPERVAGMHFFNPAPVMPLVEVVRGAQASTDTVEALVSLARRMGKTPVVTRDTPGFIVNRVARPFYGEALRILGEGAATFEQIDRIVRLGGGFRMGPFQLMDLIGIDINFMATQSVYEQSFYEPRFRPHLIQAQMVQKKALGRKTGQGFYNYSGPVTEEPVSSPAAIATLDRSRSIRYFGGTFAPGLLAALQNAGFIIEDIPDDQGVPLAAIVTTGKSEGLAEKIFQIDESLPQEIPLLVACDDVTLGEISTWVIHPERLVGFDGLFWNNGSLVTLASAAGLEAEHKQVAEGLMAGLGKTVQWIQDSPGMILPRIVCMLANEAAFALGEGIAAAETIDEAMQLGTNYPKGPLAWAREIGFSKVAAVIQHLNFDFNEDRYRLAPQLLRWARAELSQKAAKEYQDTEYLFRK